LAALLSLSKQVQLAIVSTPHLVVEQGGFGFVDAVEDLSYYFVMTITPLRFDKATPLLCRSMYDLGVIFIK
jgi:hypothetical protein